MKIFRIIFVTLAICSCYFNAFAQKEKLVKLHVDTRWKDCSFQLDPSLTQQEWRKFTKELGMFTYFRSLADAKPMGKWRFEVSRMQWNTKFNDTDPAWNNTFVHPDSTHYLKDGSRLPFPGLSGRLGITDKLDLGLFWTKNFNANYGVWGGQIQYNLVNDLEKRWATSARLSFTSLYGPEDLNLNTYGIDLLASKEFPIYSDKVFIAPYLGVSSYLIRSHEKSDVVDLTNENVVGLQSMVGAVLKVPFVRLAMEYNFANVSTISFKLGVAF